MEKYYNSYYEFIRNNYKANEETYLKINSLFGEFIIIYEHHNDILRTNFHYLFEGVGLKEPGYLNHIIVDLSDFQFNQKYISILKRFLKSKHKGKKPEQIALYENQFKLLSQYETHLDDVRNLRNSLMHRKWEIVHYIDETIFGYTSTKIRYAKKTKTLKLTNMEIDIKNLENAVKNLCGLVDLSTVIEFHLSHSGNPFESNTPELLNKINFKELITDTNPA